MVLGNKKNETRPKTAHMKTTNYETFGFQLMKWFHQSCYVASLERPVPKVMISLQATGAGVQLACISLLCSAGITQVLAHNALRSTFLTKPPYVALRQPGLCLRQKFMEPH